MSDCLGANDASTSALDAQTRKQERISAAYESATEEARDRVGSLALMLAENVPEDEIRQIGARQAVTFMRTDCRWIFNDGELLRMTGPDYDAEMRLAAMNELWRRHMEASREWIKRRAGDA